LKRALTLYPAFALVSINITLNSLAFFSPSSVVTCLCYTNPVPFLRQISFVSNQHNNNIVSSFSSNVINPFRGIDK
jgi:hypothetical protein